VRIYFSFTVTELCGFVVNMDINVIGREILNTLNLGTADNITNYVMTRLTSVDWPCSSAYIHQTDAGSSP